MKDENANPCEKYELAITNYAMGEDMPISKDELFEHLRNCVKCRADLVDWQDTYASWRTEATVSQPEAKKRMDVLIEQFKSSAQVEKAPTDVKVEIDSAAGKIQKVLKTHGETPIQELRQKTGLVDYPFYEAMSWLVMNDKAVYTKDQDNRPSYVSPR